MTDDATTPGGTSPDVHNQANPDMAAARADLIAALEGAGLEPGEDGTDPAEPLAKVGGRGVSLELRLNGETIPLDGRDVNELAPDAHQPFLHQQVVRIEAGELDAAIGRAMQADGPGKALARVRALDNG